MGDIYSWILSPEIREYLRGHYKPDLMEQQALIRGAYCPIEEKLSALRELCGEAEAETEEDRLFLERVIGVYQFAIQEIRECRRDEFYLSQTALQFGGDSGLFAYPFSYIGETKAEIFRSHGEMVGGNGSLYCLVSCGYQVEKWQRKGEWGPVLSFDLKDGGKRQMVKKGIAKKQPHDTCVSYGCFPGKENFFIRSALRLCSLSFINTKAK